MKPVFFLCLFSLIFTLNLHGQIRWHVNFTPGLSYVPPAPLEIRQSGHKTIRLWARYQSAPLKLPPYYSYRLGFMENSRGWEVELNHLKVYLRNRPEEIERFSISHGYNQLFINKIYRKNHICRKAGIGLVAAHPENTVRGMTLNEKQGFLKEGYYLTGPALQYGIWRELPIGQRFHLLTEARISAAWASVPVVNGYAHAPIIALHFQIGPGFRL
jgi:hypothetical protein